MKLKENSIIYIGCPANYATGGPEDLHQLASELISQGKTAYMYYFHYDENNFSSSIHPTYENYNISYTTHVENNSDNVFNFPETFSTFILKKNLTNYSKLYGG